MRMNRTWIVVAVLLLGASCARQSKQPTVSEQAQSRWNAARATVLYNLGRDQYAAGNFESARKSVTEALRLDPTNANVLVLSARLDIESGRLESAVAALQAARESAPLDPEPDYLLGVIAQRWQRCDEALQHYASATTKNPNELAYLLAQSEMLVQLGRPDEALSMLQSKVVHYENSAAIRDAVGQLLMQAGRPAEAAEMFRQASILASEDAAIREHLGLALYQSGRFREANEVLTRLTGEEPFASRADLWLAIGECRLKLGRFAEARSAFETASGLDPHEVATWLGIAKSALRLNDVRRAEISVRKALVINPNSADVQLALGYLRLKQDRFDEARQAFEKALSRSPADPVTLCLLGLSLERLGQRDRASECYLRALKLDPSDELATRLLGSLEPSR